MGHPLLAGYERYAVRGRSPNWVNHKGVYGPPPGQPMRQAFDSFPSFGASAGLYGNDAAVAGGMVFLESELEKRDNKVREPLTSVTYPRDIIIKSGGGWVDHTSTFNVGYGTTGPNQLGFMGTETNMIPVIQANVSKNIWDVVNWGQVAKVTFIDMAKSSGAGRSLDDMYDKGIRLNWNKSLDVTTYTGWGTNPGLINNSAVTRMSVPNGAGGSPNWINKTQNEILNDINTALVNTWAASQYDVTGMADTLLIPPAQYAFITEPVSAAGTVSILEYVLKNNVGRTQGVDLKIFPSRWCIQAGTASTDRMVAYVNNDDRVYLDVTVPVQRIMTQPSVQEGGAYLTLYLGQIGVVKILYGQAIAYFDGL